MHLVATNTEQGLPHCINGLSGSFCLADGTRTRWRRYVPEGLSNFFQIEEMYISIWPPYVIIICMYTILGNTCLIRVACLCLLLCSLHLFCKWLGDVPVRLVNARAESLHLYKSILGIQPLGICVNKPPTPMLPMSNEFKGDWSQSIENV